MSAAGASLMSVRRLAYEAGGARLLDAVDLDLREGARTVLLGPNGAGKSLVLRVLHGLVPPSEGRVTWRGVGFDARARWAQAMVFQRPVLLRRSVAANLAFALKVRGIVGAERRRRIAEGLERAGLAALADRPARVLSGGEQQRLALARALACDPEMLLLDEPTASLDPAATHAVEAIVNDAHARGVTVVMVTHDAGQARRMGDDAVFLDQGRVAEFGPARDLLDAPRTEPVRAWVEGRLHLPTLRERAA